MDARTKNSRLAQAIQQRTGAAIPQYLCGTLRRIALTLHRWAEEECNGTIQRDDKPGDPIHGTGKPRRYWESRDGTHRRGSIIPDREMGALKRLAAICKAHSLYFYHQTDPRGCAVYISNTLLTDQNYTNGVAIA